MKIVQNFRLSGSEDRLDMAFENGVVDWIRPHTGTIADAENLDGKSIRPSFVDAHCHILPTGLDLQKLHLGSAKTTDDVLDLVRERHSQQPDGWLHAVHYDQNKYGHHLRREQLDQISSERPILLRHVSGHSSIANSAALTAAGIDHQTPDPSGGTYVRDESGNLTGVLLESAHEHVTNASPNPTLEEMVDAIVRAGASMRDLGISCASDMMTGRFNLAQELNAYRIAADRGCAVATRLYLQWGTVFGRRAIPGEQLQELLQTLDGGSNSRCRVSGIKIFADGAIGSATAAIYGRYSGEAADGPVLSHHAKAAKHPDREVSGTLIYTPDKLNRMVVTAHDAGYQVAIHSIGDYATDLVLDAFEATGEASRHRIEHAMILSDAQIERLAKLNPYVTFQPEFLIRFGHTYQRQLGERAKNLKRIRSVIDAGLRVSFSSDRPIVAGDPLVGIRTAVQRPDGFDPAENCTLDEALNAYTVEGSRVNGDGDFWGCLATGSCCEYEVVKTEPS